MCNQRLNASPSCSGCLCMCSLQTMLSIDFSWLVKKRNLFHAENVLGGRDKYYLKKEKKMYLHKFYLKVER